LKLVYHTCDMCGRRMAEGQDLRFVAKIQVHASADPLEITAEDLEGDIREKMRRLIEELKDMDPQEVERSVYCAFQFDLCPRCWKRYIEDPLPRWTPADLPGEEKT